MSGPISSLAAVDAQTRWPMTCAFLSLAAGLGMFGVGMTSSHPAAARAATVTALATVGVAATPLGSRLGGAGHAVAAGAAYVSLAAVPGLAAIDLRRHARFGASRVAGVAAGVTAVALVMSVATTSRAGGWQRVGLTTGHAWIAFYAIGSQIRGRKRMLRGSSPSAP